MVLPTLIVPEAPIGGQLMITIHRATSSKSDKVRVTFSMPAIHGCERLYLVGWFSEWNESVYLMEPMPGGGWSLTLELEAGCTYQYRFRTLDGSWLNDPDAPPASVQHGLNRSFVISRSDLIGAATRPLPARRSVSAPPS